MAQDKGSGWIGAGTGTFSETEGPVVHYYRKNIELPEAAWDLKIEITADSKYKLYVNGKLVNVGPQKGDANLWYRDELDLGGFVRPGLNVVVVAVLSVPNRPRAGNYSFARTDTPGLYLRGPYGFDGDSGWKYSRAKVSVRAESPDFAPLCVFEDAVGSPFNASGFDADYDDGDWQDAVAYGPRDLAERLKGENLLPRAIPLMRMDRKRFEGVKAVRQSVLAPGAWDAFVERDEPVTIPARTVEIAEISAGAETTGYLKLAMSGGLGATVRILTSECYAFEGIEGLKGPFLPRKGDRTDSVNGRLYGFTDTYRPCGAGTADSPETYEPFWFRTFRFVRLEIETGDAPLTLSSLDFTETGYPLEVKTSVKTSDPTLERVWEISERSLRLCMHETYEDCPFYEQLQYAMDTRSQILYTYAVSGDDRLARQAMDDFRRSSRFDGQINCSYPNFENHVIPGFAIYYVGMVYDHMMYFGDGELVRDHIPAILGVLNFFRKRLDSKGLVGKLGGLLFEPGFWSFIDWTSQWRDSFGVPPATFSGPITMESLLYALGLQYASALFAYAGFGDLAASAAADARAVQDAVNAHCRGAGGMYQDGPGIDQYSQHCQVFAALTGTVDPETGKKYIAETLDRKDDYAQCSVAMMYYLFRALETCGLYERTDALWDTWRSMVAKNLTTCEEDSVLSRSDCHGWGALALFEFPSAILGIRPAAPGYAEVAVNPLPGKLTSAEGSVITPRGVVAVSWQLTDGKIVTRVSAPEGVKIVSKSGKGA